VLCTQFLESDACNSLWFPGYGSQWPGVHYCSGLFPRWVIWTQVKQKLRVDGMRLKDFRAKLHNFSRKRTWPFCLPLRTERSWFSLSPSKGFCLCSGGGACHRWNLAIVNPEFLELTEPFSGGWGVPLTQWPSPADFCQTTCWRGIDHGTPKCSQPPPLSQRCSAVSYLNSCFSS
jgi:hypothetical protein